MVITTWARIEDGGVAAITKISPEGRYHPSMRWVACPDDVSPGWTFDGVVFAAPVDIEPSIQVPASITMRQARLCLHAHGLLASVQPAIDSLAEPQKTRAQIEWDYSSTVERYREFVQMIGAGLGLTDQQLDELFIEAAGL